MKDLPLNLQSKRRLSDKDANRGSLNVTFEYQGCPTSGCQSLSRIANGSKPRHESTRTDRPRRRQTIAAKPSATRLEEDDQVDRLDELLADLTMANFSLIDGQRITDKTVCIESPLSVLRLPKELPDPVVVDNLIGLSPPTTARHQLKNSPDMPLLDLPEVADWDEMGKQAANVVMPVQPSARTSLSHQTDSVADHLITLTNCDPTISPIEDSRPNCTRQSDEGPSDTGQELCCRSQNGTFAISSPVKAAGEISSKDQTCELKNKINVTFDLIQLSPPPDLCPIEATFTKARDSTYVQDDHHDLLTSISPSVSNSIEFDLSHASQLPQSTPLVARGRSKRTSGLSSRVGVIQQSGLPKPASRRMTIHVPQHASNGRTVQSKGTDVPNRRAKVGRPEPRIASVNSGRSVLAPLTSNAGPVGLRHQSTRLQTRDRLTRRGRP